MPLKTADDYARACTITKQVIDRWDPYALLASGAPSDEFASRAADVVRHIPAMRNSQDAAQAISEVFSDAFEPEHFQLAQCREVASELFEALRKAGLLSG